MNKLSSLDVAPRLDKYQMQLINSQSNVYVIAGAGTGKSTTIVAKINDLIATDTCTPEEILAISFTNASTQDLILKIKSNVNVWTFHKLAMFILKECNIDYKICPTNFLDFIIIEELNRVAPTDETIILKFLNISLTYSQFLKSRYFKSFCKLIESYINIFKTNFYSIQNILNNNYTLLEKRILLIIFKIYQKYIIEKNSQNFLDFDDLIIVATDLVCKSNLHFKYVIVDEFQDTSLIRMNLIKKIQEFTLAKVIVVGDDWQSIYSFSGCDLNVFLKFPTTFQNVKSIYLKNTYRNSQELINIASSFIQKNKLQIKKELISQKHNPKPVILVPHKNSILSFKKLLNYLLSQNKDIIILVRNVKDIYNYIDASFGVVTNGLLYQEHLIKLYTVHKSKGLEAETVIVLNCNDAIMGFPNKIENNILISKLVPKSEMKYAEERRLFYVAITRCKETTYLMYNANTPSVFIKEIKKYIKKELKTIPYFN